MTRSNSDSAGARQTLKKNLRTSNRAQRLRRRLTVLARSAFIHCSGRIVWGPHIPAAWTTGRVELRIPPFKHAESELSPRQAQAVCRLRNVVQPVDVVVDGLLVAITPRLPRLVYAHCIAGYWRPASPDDGTELAKVSAGPRP